MVDASGFDEVGLLSLSSADHTEEKVHVTGSGVAEGVSRRTQQRTAVCGPIRICLRRIREPLSVENRSADDVA